MPPSDGPGLGGHLSLPCVHGPDEGFRLVTFEKPAVIDLHIVVLPDLDAPRPFPGSAGAIYPDHFRITFLASGSSMNHM